MKVSDLIPLPVHKFKFHLSQAKFVTSASGCYAITTFDGEIVYVGLSKNIRSRCMQHLDRTEKTKINEIGKPYWFWFLEWDEKKIENLERSWMNLIMSKDGKNPILNKVYSPLGG